MQRIKERLQLTVRDRLQEMDLDNMLHIPLSSTPELESAGPSHIYPEIPVEPS